MEKAYISIDIDFWNSAKGANNALTKFFDTLPPGVGKIAVMNHQQMERAVSASEARALINIDAHSDVSTSECETFNCGTWISYVKWAREGRLVWVRADEDFRIGNCNDTREWDYDLIWPKAESVLKGQNFDIAKFLQKYNVVDVGLCLSPDFNADTAFGGANGKVEEVFRALVAKYKFPYLKGRRNENFNRKRKAA